MGLLNEALQTRRTFDATNRRLLAALTAALDDGAISQEEKITLSMSSALYQELTARGYYIEIPRKKVPQKGTDRRRGDRRHGDTQQSDRREENRIWDTSQ